ncbi:hypothetical protein R75461_01161 [Paraburkholderia nemoris]|nr:hypothetical protein R75461_01161 [Paraburkholderia nemoris]
MSWIKMRDELQTHPKVVRILSATKSDKFRVVGGLHAVWCIFDQHSIDGVLVGYTPETLDHIIGWKGFADAMISVGWLTHDGSETLVLPEFEEHNGQSGKRRAEDQKRKKGERKADKMNEFYGQESVNDSDKSRTESGTRGGVEKEKEKDKSKPKNIRFDALAHLESLGVEQKIASDWLALRKAKKLAPTETAFAGVLRQAERAGISMNDAVQTCCIRGWGGFEAAWLKDRPATPSSGSSVADEYADLMRGSL